MLWMDKLPKVLKGRTKTKYLGQENDFLLKRQFCYKYSEITKALHNLKRFKILWWKVTFHHFYILYNKTETN